jgi:hypothetical protein
VGCSQTMARGLALGELVALAACGGGPTPPQTAAACKTASGQQIALAVGQYLSPAPPADAGCLIFPGNPSSTDSIQYLLVPQLATSMEGANTSFALEGDTLHAALAAPAVGTLAGGFGVAEQFHDFLRRQERTHYAALPPAPSGVTRPSVALQLGPPVVGSMRAFSVCADLNCSNFQSVTATAQAVSGHLAVYVDNAAPSGGLTAAQLDSLASLFDTTLYAVDTTAFGRESDIDSNTVVVVLMTNVVNKLVTTQQCTQSGFIAGFFFGFDIDPQYKNDPRSNHGEVFYSIVADPSGTLSCAHSASQLTRGIVPRTFVHEFQHMISYNQHVLLRNGPVQVTWLDEGMSHLAEELGGRRFLPGDTTTFLNYVRGGDEYNAYQFLDATDAHYLAFSAGIGTLAERGAAWLFVRYLTDQFRTDTSFAATAVFTRSLEQTPLVGGAAIEAATGTPFATVDERWMLANYVSDLPGFTAPPELRYTSWNLRVTFASLHVLNDSIFPKVFPITPPVSAGNAVSLSGTLHAGSGSYALAVQPPSAPGFTLFFSGPSGVALPANLTPVLNVIRLR